VVAIMQENNIRDRIKRLILDRLNISPRAVQGGSQEPDQSFAESEANSLVAEKKSKAELARLQKLIEDRKQIARDTDISHHLWGLYKSHLQTTGLHSLEQHIQDGEWYDVKILQVSSQNGLNKFEFELKGNRYIFVDDEENQNWSSNTKFFSLFLNDDSGRCLIEVPMKIKVDSAGRRYSVTSDGPKAFLPGDWVNDFTSVTLKHQRIRNQEIRAQKHQERLSEIEELKNRFGIAD
jgi:hypothetical protein